MPSLYEEYFSTIDEYSRKYTNVLVLMQKGSFYEMYEICTPDRHVGQCHEVRDALKRRTDVPYELTLTLASSKVAHSAKNPYMIGFPVCAFDGKWKHVLVQLGYTVVKMDQVSGTSNGTRMERRVTEIATEGTMLNETSLSTCVLCVYVDAHTTESGRLEHTPVSVGATALDLVTGRTTTIECEDLSVLLRFASEMAARELFLYSSSSTSDEYTQFVRQYVVSTHRYTNVTVSSDVNREYGRVEYQRDFLRSVYELRTNLCPIEALGFDRERYALMAFLLLVQSVHEYNETITKRLQRPVRYSSRGRMYMPHNSIRHLHLVSRNGLLDTINFTLTAMGRRYLKERLLQPFTRVTDIRRVHRNVDAVNVHLDTLRAQLRPIPDLERLVRLVALGTATATQFTAFCDAVKAVCELSTPLPFRGMDNMRTLHTFLERTVARPFELTVTGPTFAFRRRTPHMSEFAQLYAELESFAATYAPHAELEWIDDRCLVTMTRARARHYRVNATDVKGGRASVSTDRTQYVSTRLHELRVEIEAYNQRKYAQLLLLVYDRFERTLRATIEYVTRLDYACSVAECSRRYKYCRPTVVEADVSRLEVTALRHPIIERLLDDEEYVPNDVTMHADGMLLYGPNSIGKTSLAKAIGSCVIMAQMGYGVAASSMTLAPYTRILTRLSGDDDMHRGHSSFVVEMLELRSILQQADAQSLILGDELCRGTESTSGTALTVATIRRLVSTRSSFLFATHMHHLVDVPQLRESIDTGRVRVRHLHISRDPRDPHVLVYDRRLRDGPSPSVYGLEIAESLDLDRDFLRDANDIRQSFGGVKRDILSTKRSRYHARVYVDECFKCGKRKNLHTHHLREQHEADNRGFIDHVHKNTRANLTIVCEQCHHELHIDHVRLKRMRTTNGIAIVEAS